jgi:hypothetical protein
MEADVEVAVVEEGGVEEDVARITKRFTEVVAEVCANPHTLHNRET